MSIVDRIKSWASRTVVKYDTDWFLRFASIANSEDGAQTVADPYKVHAWINIGVSTIAKNISRAEFKIYNGDKEAGPGDRTQKLFDFVNPNMSKYQLWEATVSWKRLKGEAFWAYALGERMAFPMQIIVLDPANMHHVLNSSKTEVVGWQYQDGQLKVPFALDEIIHFHTWNPWNAFRGVSEFTALNNEVAQDVSSNKYINGLLNNRSIPDGILSIPEMVSEEDAKVAAQAWEKAHKGAAKAHKIAVLGGGATFIPTAMNPADLQYLQLKGYNRTTILAKLGVPPEIVGVHEGNTPLSGVNTKQVMQQFWNLTLIPEIRSIEDKLKTEFFSRLRLNQEGRFDLDDIPELQEDEEKKIARMLAEVTAGTLTANEMRDELDRDPVKWGDSWWVSIGMKPAGEEPPKPKIPVETLFTEEDDDKEYDGIDGLIKAIEAVNKAPEYTAEFKAAHFEKITRTTEPIEEEYTAKLKKWFYGIRSDLLKELNKKAIGDMTLLLDDELYWQEQLVKLQTVADPTYTITMEASAVVAADLLRDLNIDIAIDWNIYNTRAPKYVAQRVTKVVDISKTVQKELRKAVHDTFVEGLTPVEQHSAFSDAIKNVANKAQNRAATIAKTEVGGVWNDTRNETFTDLGITEHEWALGPSAEHRDDHLAADGEIRKIGETFSTGLAYPHDPNGLAEQVINCACYTYPIIGDE